MISSSEVTLKELCKILRVYFIRDVLCNAVSFRPIQQCIFIIHTTCKLKDYDRNLIADKGLMYIPATETDLSMSHHDHNHYRLYTLTRWELYAMDNQKYSYLPITWCILHIVFYAAEAKKYIL